MFEGHKGKRVNRVIAATMLATGAAGCTAPAALSPTASDNIRYETSACFGRCPVYVLTVARDGHGSFEGKRFTAATGARTFTVTPAQFAAFAAALAPFRPEGERALVPGRPGCERAATDQPSVEITWSDGDHLQAYYGCNMETNRAMFAALRHAPQLLPIAAFIDGKH